MKPEQIVEIVKASGLRGRGGAGFAAGMKWSFMPKDDVPSRATSPCNGDESEPGTFKDRQILERNPHQFIEGAADRRLRDPIDAAYVYMRGEYRGRTRS